MSKIWIATVTTDNNATSYDIEVEAETFTQATIEAVYRLPASNNDCYVVKMAEKA